MESGHFEVISHRREEALSELLQTLYLRVMQLKV